MSSTNGGTGNTASATLAVVPVAPPSIAMAFGPTRISVGGTSTLTFTLTNPSVNTVALTGVAFSEQLPGGSFAAFHLSTCGGSARAVGSGIFVAGGSIPARSSCTVAFTVLALSAGTFAATSGPVSSTNGGTGNTATATLAVTASCPMIFNRCTVMIAVGPRTATLTSALVQAAPVGTLVQRVVGERLVTIGRVPFGPRPEGPLTLRWDLRVNGHRLPAGRYLITLRALDATGNVLATAAPVEIEIDREGHGHGLRAGAGQPIR